MADMVHDGGLQGWRFSRKGQKPTLRPWLPLASIAAACMLAGPAASQQAEPTGKPEISATFYLWASGLQGSQSMFGLPSSNVDLRFGDILDKVDMAAAGIFEVRGDRLGFLGELNYVKLSADAETPGGLLQGGLESKAFFALAAATWRVAETDRQAVAEYLLAVPDVE